MKRLLLVGLLVVGWVAAGVPASSTTAQSVALAQDERADFPPGLSESGVTDPLALADAHRNALQNASYTMATTFTFRRPNGTVLSRGTSTARVAAGGETYFAVTSQTSPNGSQPLGLGHFELATWANETHAVTARQFSDGDTTYRRTTRADAPMTPSTQWELLYSAFAATNSTVVGQFERDGTTLFRVVSTAQPGSRSPYPDHARYGFVATVDSEGVVRTFQLTYRTTFEDRPAIVTRTVHVTNVGNTTVERPPWYDRAVENATG